MIAVRLLLLALSLYGLTRLAMRRLTLPLAADRWDGEDIDVSIIPAGLLLQTPIKPEDN